MRTLRLYLSDDTVGRFFAKATFPQVRTLVILACHARFFVPCCPKVRAVISLYKIEGWSSMLKGVFDESGETLEVLEGFMMSPATIQCQFLYDSPVQ
jgi:hypothetical protein